MKKNWIGAAMMVGVSVLAGLLLSQMWEQVLGQPAGGFSTPAPQVVMNVPAELPKCYVDFTTLPTVHGEIPRIRVITVVDTEAKRIAVYHMEMFTGQLQLRGVRDIQPDLMLNQFNATLPLPSEIVGELERFKGKK